MYKMHKFNRQCLYTLPIDICHKRGIIKIQNKDSRKAERGIYMRKYEVDFYDYETGAESPIDTITAPEHYTAEQYITDCERNSDPEYFEFLKGGEIRLYEISD